MTQQLQMVTVLAEDLQLQRLSQVALNCVQLELQVTLFWTPQVATHSEPTHTQ